MATTTTTSSTRHSSRQTRTNPARNSKTAGSNLRNSSLLSNGTLSTPAAANPPQEPHGFYPAITHFTDAITALPREYRRHWSLLKEVDAKVWSPEETLNQLVEHCNTSQPSRINADTVKDPSTIATESNTHTVDSGAKTLNGMSSNSSQQEQQQALQAQRELERRQVFHGLRLTLLGMIPAMDEKNHVIDNANDDLDRQLQRLETVFPHIESEVSDEARNGSRTHWAYSNSKANAKATEGRSRKEAAAGLAIMADPDISARSESRRLAMMANKKRGQQHAESELEDAGPSTSNKKTQSAPKARRLGEVAAESGLGIITPTPTGASKRKKAEKAPTSAGGAAMERSLSGTAKGGVAMSREPSQQENGKKRRAPNTTSTARKRINVNASPANSPNLASSPLAGSFSKDIHRGSPAPPTNQRPHTSKARQNAAQNAERRAASSAGNKNTTNGTTSLSVSTPELHKVAVMTGKSTTEVKSTMKDSTTSKGDKLVETDEAGADSTTNGEAAPQGGILLERSNSKSAPEKLKREATADNDSSRPTSSRASPRQAASTTLANSTPPEPPPSARPERSARARSSKTSTPVVSTFAESGTIGRTVSTRPSRTNSTAAASSSNTDNSTSANSIPPPPPKRSHKKGAGLAAQAAALAAQQLKEREQQHREQRKKNSNNSNINNNGHGSGNGNGGGGANNEDEEVEIEEEEGSGGENEPRYCYCNGISYGEMVACDAKDCPREWFHLSCVGLEKAPGKNAKWYCNECKKGLKDRDKDKSAGGGGSGSASGNGSGKGR
ncbi:MAG: hypothetical protein Q9160_004821 [Pyrenula sp. 1 TL-2023]